MRTFKAGRKLRLFFVAFLPGIYSHELILCHIRAGSLFFNISFNVFEVFICCLFVFICFYDIFATVK